MPPVSVNFGFATSPRTKTDCRATHAAGCGLVAVIVGSWSGSFTGATTTPSIWSPPTDGLAGQAAQAPCLPRPRGHRHTRNQSEARHARELKAGPAAATTSTGEARSRQPSPSTVRTAQSYMTCLVWACVGLVPLPRWLPVSRAGRRRPKIRPTRSGRPISRLSRISWSKNTRPEAGLSRTWGEGELGRQHRQLIPVAPPRCRRR